jgi:hypothetical protein
MRTLTLQEVIEQEKEQLRLRRQKLGIEPGEEGAENWFGIALSGGGIRSATINLGFLKTLNKFGLLQKADYLSTVSGGGYTHSYIQGTVKETGDFNKLFTEEHIKSFRQHGEYMIPGQGIWKNFNTFLLVVAFLVSWLMSLISPVIVIGIIYHLYVIITGLIGENPFSNLDLWQAHIGLEWLLMISGGLFLVHVVANIILNYNLSVSRLFNRIEAVVVLLGLILFAWVKVTEFKGSSYLEGGQLMDYVINAVLLFILGYFINPNALSFHRYYRKQLADLFLRFSGNNENMPLKDVFNAKSEKKEDYIAPYPLINTCLNLLNPGGDDVFKGTKTSDYFLLSPLNCGSKLVGYVPTNRYFDYERMTLPAAVTISAAAVNPGMGMYSNKFLSVMMTLFNARLGFWISNPRILVRERAIVWWPIYFFRELLGRIGSGNKMINISDGGHIENLGVYELLRRRCRLIIAVDAGEDGTYAFFDVNNMLIRARNELGLEIRFRENEQPEELIRPRPTQVYSRKRYAIADIYQWWDEVTVTNINTRQEEKQIVNFPEPQKIGTFIYVKSSVLEPKGKPFLSKEDKLKFGTYKYKIYHPDFPHESTGDQFFDEIQWEAYYQLGQYIGADVLGVKDLESYEGKEGPKFNTDQLLSWFDKGQNLFGAPESIDKGLFESTGGEEKSPAAPVFEPEVKYEM